MPVFFICFIVFILWFRVKCKQADKATNAENELFWEREREADFTPKKDISCLRYIQIDEAALPFDEGDDACEVEIQQKLRELISKKMINLSGISNTELKLEYGRANLDELTEYDQNYNQLISLLNQWGCVLFEKGDYKRAETVLNYALSIGSDISGTFITLAKVYNALNEPEKIPSLIEKADATNSLLKKSTIAHLREVLGEYR